MSLQRSMVASVCMLAVDLVAGAWGSIVAGPPNMAASPIISGLYHSKPHQCCG